MQLKVIYGCFGVRILKNFRKIGHFCKKFRKCRNFEKRLGSKKETNQFYREIPKMYLCNVLKNFQNFYEWLEMSLLDQNLPEISFILRFRLLIIQILVSRKFNLKICSINS